MKHITHNTQHITHNKGFTLIEMMVAIFILSTALISLLTLISSSLYNSQYIKNEITANYLLQEVADYIKNERVNSLYVDIADEERWGNFVDKFNECNTVDGCKIDVKSKTIEACLKEPCDILFYHNDLNTGNYYNYNNEGGVESIFSRKIVVDKGDTDELKVEATVYWGNGKNKVEKSLKFSILNWQ